MKNHFAISGDPDWVITVSGSDKRPLDLRILHPDEVTDHYVAWLNDPEVNRYLESRFVEHTVETVRDFVVGCRAQSGTLLFGIFAPGNEHIGNIKIGGIDGPHSRGDVGLIVGDKRYWGKGIATISIGAVGELARDHLGLHKLYAGSYASNNGSVRAFEKNGYTVAGRWCDHVRLPDGTYDDVVLLEKIFQPAT
ncbi:MAG: GNAT family N-acetyltransferase [Spirochaeta sp.]|nr:GNAT family N-acetyltransferase [Spirochaeta sp.]